MVLVEIGRVFGKEAGLNLLDSVVLRQTEILGKALVLVIQTAEVIARGVLKTEGHLLAFVLLPVSLGVEVDIRSRTVRVAEHGNGMVGSRMVQLQARQHNVIKRVGAVKETLSGCKELAAQCTICRVHHVAGTTVVGVGAVGEVDLGRDDIHWDGILTDADLVLCKQRYGLVPQRAIVTHCDNLLTRVQRLDDANIFVGFTINNIRRLILALAGKVVAGVLYGTLGRCRALIALAHVVGYEVTPRTFRVAVGQVDKHLITR